MRKYKNITRDFSPVPSESRIFYINRIPSLTLICLESLHLIRFIFLNSFQNFAYDDFICPSWARIYCIRGYIHEFEIISLAIFTLLIYIFDHFLKGNITFAFVEINSSNNYYKMKIRKKTILVQISLIFERIFKVTVTLIKIVEYYRTLNGLNSASFQKMSNFA